MHRRFLIGLAVTILAAGAIIFGLTATWNAERSSEPSHAERVERITLSDPIALGTALYGDLGAHAIAVDTWIRAETERLAREQAEAEAAAEAERSAALRAQAQSAPRSARGSCNGDFDGCFKECTIDHESRSSGVYGAVSPGGTYRGAYQFDQPTWNGAVERAGHGEYVGTPPNEAPPEVQDAAARQLYSERGNQPWGGRC